jgi:hypothetical protein
MRKFLIAATIVIPFAAFANQPPPRQDGGQVQGNVALTASGSLAGVQSQQGTMAGSMVRGDGVVTNGAIAGSYTTIDTTGSAQAGKGFAGTETRATQLNVGGVITGGSANAGKGRGNTATGTASGMQNSSAVGGSVAAAADLNGSLKMQQPTRPSRR